MLDHGFSKEDGSPPLRCCEGGRRFFGPAGRLNYISINEPLICATRQLLTENNPCGLVTVQTRLQLKMDGNNHEVQRYVQS